MKNLKGLFLLLLFTGLTACSVEEVDENSEFGIQEVNAVVEIPGCEVVSYSFDQAGHIEVTNDQDSLYVSIISTNDHLLVSTKLHIANSPDNFPTVGQGNLPPGQMDQQENFDSGVEHVSYSYPLSDFEGCIYLASQSSFVSGSESVTLWAGNISGKSGKWSYFEYCIQDCDPVCDIDAGSNNTKTITYSEAAALPSWDEVRKLYLRLLDDGVSNDGTFDPSIWDLINAFNENGLGDYSTKYTIGEGECTDSVILTIRVVAD